VVKRSHRSENVVSRGATRVRLSHTAPRGPKERSGFGSKIISVLLLAMPLKINTYEPADGILG